MSLEVMKRRIRYDGGAAQQDRMIKDKLRSMLSATKSSYQAARFNAYPEFPKKWTGLFNPVTQNMDYDTKLISIPFEAGYKVGTVFRWEETGTFWICYAWDRTELAYFRGSCRRCDYKVKWVDGNKQLCETYVSVIGPNQPLENNQVNGNVGAALDFPNANLTMYLTDDEKNRGYFHQDQIFVLKGDSYKVTNIDHFSMPGVIQVFAVKDYTNLIENDVEENIANAWNIQPVIPHYNEEYGIVGPTSIKPLFDAEFRAIVDGGEWVIVENMSLPRQKLLPVEFVEYEVHQQVIHVKWTKPTSGAFTIGYRVPGGDMMYQKHIIVESLM